MTERAAPTLAINARTAEIRPSATLAVSARAEALRAQGKAVVNLSAGEPDFRPPQAVADAVTELVQRAPIHYAPVAGMPALRDAAAAELTRVHGRPFERGEVLVSSGAKQALTNLFFVTLEPGDEVVLFAPFWVSYTEMVRIAGGTPKIVDTTLERGWQVDPDALAAALGPRTRFVVFNSPANPTGAGLSAEHLRRLAAVIDARAPQAWLCFDDIYRRLSYGEFAHASAYRSLPGFDRIVVVDGVSKSYAMTGYRIGFLAGPAAVISAAARVQGQMTSGAATPSQVAALTALRAPSCDAAAVAMAEAFARRRALAVAELGAIPGVRFHPPEGAFYVFMDVAPYLGEGARFADDEALTRWLLDEHLVATVPGTAFHAPGHVRLSYATGDDDLRVGLARLREAFASLPRRDG
ncbi:MAG: pyridoxal phosphate-dependent aminotransferase [Nannocystaceae bacterium]